MSNDKRIQKWADPAMFRAEEVDASGPKVYLLEMTSDPLGSVAALSAMYTGKVTRSKDDVTDDERDHHLREMQKTKLTTPLEAVKLHFMIEGVTRAFTHQLVRNRTSAYAQESMRFAVKEDMPVALPPSLSGTLSERDLIGKWHEQGWYLGGVDFDTTNPQLQPDEIELLEGPQKMRIIWDRQVGGIRDTYNRLIALGMPAEDARGLAPTNVLTRINWVTDLRTLIDVLGVRLCTQAQFEWRAVATAIAEAIGNGYKKDRRWLLAESFYTSGDAFGSAANDASDMMERVEGEYAAIASLFRPICYKTGKCEFKSDADRACSIRDRVEANHQIGRPSSEWGVPKLGAWLGDDVPRKPGGPIHEPDIEAIRPEEWMFDPSAAR